MALPKIRSFIIGGCFKMETDNSLKNILILASICLGLFLVYLLGPILTPFLVGMGIAYLGDPLVDRLEGRLGRTGGVIVVFILIFSFLIATFFLLVPMLISEVSSLIRSVPVFIQWLQQTASPVLIKNFGIDPFAFGIGDIKSQLTDNWQQVGSVARKLVTQVTASGFSIAIAAANLALIPVVSFYLMRDWDILVGYMRDILPRGKESVTVGLVKECDEVLSAFIRGQLLVMFVLGCVYASGLMLFGLELALLIGMIAGLASIVPYLGFFVGIAAASIAAFIQFQDAFFLIYVAMVFGFGQMLEAWVLTPLLVGDRIGLHPVAVIFAILAGGQLFGFTGILLALPVAAVIMVFIRHLHDRYKASEYYGAERLPAEGEE
ncbi:MAG: putative PurR-regulated permease PerM [Candidatus Azotimanducaceae bacterium]|jgi:predicted PurR-regulated permease PerM